MGMGLAYLPGFLELDEDPPAPERPPAPTAEVEAPDALVVPAANESPSWKALPI